MPGAGYFFSRRGVNDIEKGNKEGGEDDAEGGPQPAGPSNNQEAGKSGVGKNRVGNDLAYRDGIRLLPAGDLVMILHEGVVHIGKQYYLLP